MKKNVEIAQNVLAAVGGKENVANVQHCMTRLRFTLADDTIPKDDDVKKIPGVLGVARTGGQYQVIIGQNVGKVYDAVCQQGGFAAKTAPKDFPDAPKERLTPKTVGNNIMNYLSGSFTPLIPVIIAAALFRTVALLLGPTMLKLIAEEGDVYVVCNAMYEAAFYFLPVFLGYTAAKKIGATPVLGMMIGTALIVPDFINLVGVQETIQIYGFLPAPVAAYNQTVLPIIIAVFFLFYVEKFFKKVIPEFLSTIFVPFLTMVVMVPLTFCFAAPAGSWIGTILGNALFWFANHGGFIALAILAAFYQFLVLVGMHHVIGMLAITVMLERGVEFCVRPAGSIANWGCFGMALGAALRIRNKEEKALCFGYYATALIGGITEPTMFGVGIRYKRPFIGMVIGGFVGGLYAGLSHVGCYTFASPGFMSVLAFAPGGTANLVNGTIACVAAMIVSAVSTYIIGGFDDGEQKLSFLRRKPQ